MNNRWSAWGSVLVVMGAAACGWFGGCSSDNTDTTPPADSGPTDSGVGDTTIDTGTDTGTDSGADTAVDSGPGDVSDTSDGGGLSAQATAGIAASPFTISTTGLTPDQIEQIGVGSYIVNVVSSCPDCHNNPTKTLPAGYLAGGTVFGPVTARNLTSDATNGLRMTEAQFLETIQTGKDQKLSGKVDGGGDVALIVMPWTDYRWMSVTDLKAVYAYLKIVPADTTADVLGKPGGPPIPAPTTFTDGAATTAPTLPAEAGDAPLFPKRGRAIQALVEPTAVASLSAADQAIYGRGAYLVGIAPCGECHTNPERPSFTSTKYNTAQWLTGGRVFVSGPGLDAIVKVERSMSANLLGATNGFIFQTKTTEKIFSDTITKGVHADETPPTRPLAWPMPRAFKNLVPDDVHAIWTYLKNQTPITGSADKATQEAAVYCSSTVPCATGATCNTATSECLPTATCTKDADCSACQTCNTGTSKCVVPVTSADAATATCVSSGI
jgi:hypothetical protein